MGMVLPTRGQLAMSGHIFGFPNWERECYWPLEVDGREAARRGQCTGNPPPPPTSKRQRALNIFTTKVEKSCPGKITSFKFPNTTFST